MVEGLRATSAETFATQQKNDTNFSCGFLSSRMRNTSSQFKDGVISEENGRLTTKSADFRGFKHMDQHSDRENNNYKNSLPAPSHRKQQDSNL